MSLIDPADNILMLGAYGWAFIKPIRKLYYNLTITAVSAIVACVVGGIEALGLVGGGNSLRRFRKYRPNPNVSTPADGC
jgi:high-affinity nickel-transport protein